MTALNGGFRFKVASEPHEFEQIHRLNYQTFVDEIPQHQPNDNGLLVDRFHANNTYVISMLGNVVVGMICARTERPFSLDAKVQNLDGYLPPGHSPCEIRLLSVSPEHRTGVVFRGLVEGVVRHCVANGHDLALISGTERQLRLYQQLGFVAFGERVGTPGAWFQPMYLTLDTYRDKAVAFSRERESLSFLPGPVELHPAVREALGAAPVSHRGSAFANDFDDVRRGLRELTGASHVQLLLGSGTLANDAIAARLSTLRAPGLVLTNGEFGDRLVDHAERWNLRAQVLRADWGEPVGSGEVEAALDTNPAIDWVWAVHCETSTGVLNDIAGLKEICVRRRVRLCVDCISSLGTVPVDLTGVHLASGVSGKGLGSVPGLSMVFHDEPLASSDVRLPRYLDLELYEAEGGFPFTQSSNLVRALRAALRALADRPAQFATTAADAKWLRARLRDAGYAVVAPDQHASPAVTTLALPDSLSAAEVGELLASKGYLVSCNSGYLQRRNWIQVCLMGAYRRDRIAPLVELLKHVYAQAGRQVGVSGT